MDVKIYCLDYKWIMLLLLLLLKIYEA